MRVAIVTKAFEPLEELALFERTTVACGAVASFVGRCRPRSGNDAVRTLELQHYPGFTEQEIARFASALVTRLSLNDALVVHRVGAIVPGEAIVLVATAGAHRGEALEGTQALIDFLKTDAPLWKRETTSAGSAWVEPTAHDYTRSSKVHSKS